MTQNQDASGTGQAGGTLNQNKFGSGKAGGMGVTRVSPCRSCYSRLSCKMLTFYLNFAILNLVIKVNFQVIMNITELARRLRISTQELRDKLPSLGFDIGQKAVKIDERLAGRIIRAYREYQDREKQKAEYLKRNEKKEESSKTSKVIKSEPKIAKKEAKTEEKKPVKKSTLKSRKSPSSES